MIDKEYLGHRLIERGFEVWFRYVFRMIEGHSFVVEPIHADLFQMVQDIFEGKSPRTICNVPPRSAKTTLMKYFIAFCWAIDPSMNFIYTSYSEALLAGISRELMNILEHPAFLQMYPHTKAAETDEDITPNDEFWFEKLKQYYGNRNIYTSKKINTYKGGICLFSPIGGQITGFGCFDYNTLVLTEKGYKKIGDIVENKENIKIWSYNFEKKKRELKSIYRYIKNDISDFLKITLDNNEVIYATPDHIFYANGKEKRADNLLIGDEVMTNSFYSIQTYIQFVTNIFTSIIFIYNKFNFIIRKLFFYCIFKSSFFISLISKTFSNFIPNNATLNITNRARSNIIIFCYAFIISCVLCYCNSHFCIKFLEFSILIKFIISIFLCCTVCKIFKPIIRRIRVFMSNLLVGFTYKSSQNQTMNRKCNFTFIRHQANPFITFFTSLLFKYRFSSLRVYLSIFRNIVPFKIRNRKIINIVYCNHKTSSYCVTLWSNNNLFVGKSQVLVRNCGKRTAKSFSGALIIDDPQKPSEIRSQLLREKTLRYYEETLLSRLNNAQVPIVLIMQRLHKEDLSGILADKYHYNVICKPLLDENDICQIPSQYTPERIKELQINTFMFKSQYQQQPISEGGNVIKSEWFRYYPTQKEWHYKRILIAADTAMKVKEHNDYSVFIAGGVTDNNQLHILDIIRGKWEAPELERQAVNFWNRFKRDEHTGVTCNGFYIENKASGIGLVQALKTKYGMPVIGVEVNTDKLTRAENILPYIESGQVLLPENPNYSFNPTFLAECEEFSRDGSQIHDDQIDAAGILINQALSKTTVSILDYFM